MGNNMMDETKTIGDDILIEHLNLSKGVSKSLRKAGIKSVGDLIKYSPEELKKLPVIGPKAIECIEKELERYGYRLNCSQQEDVLDIRVLDSNLPYKVKRVLGKAGIETLGEFLKMAKGEFLASEEVFKSACITMEEEYGYSFITGRPIEDTDILSWKVGALEKIGVPRRAATVLENAHIETIQEVIKLTESELLKIRWLGEKVAKELINTLRANGLELRAEVVEEPKGGRTLATAFETKMALNCQERVLATQVRKAGKLDTSLDFEQSRR